MTNSIYQQFSLPSLYGEGFNHGPLGIINERIILPIKSTKTGPKLFIPRVAHEHDETMPALMTIAHRIGSGGVPIAGLRVTFPEDVGLEDELSSQNESISPFSSLSARDDRPFTILFQGPEMSTLDDKPAQSVINGLRSVLINKYNKVN